MSIREPLVAAISAGLPTFAVFAWSVKDVLNLLLTPRVVERYRSVRLTMKEAGADAELGAYGIADTLGGIFAVPMTVGMPARSPANIRCGGATRLSNILLVTAGAPALAQIPLVGLAAVTAWMGFCQLDWSA